MNLRKYDPNRFEPAQLFSQPIPPKQRRRQLFWTLGRYILVWIFLFVTVKFVVPSYEVKGASMLPTYRASGDRVLTDQIFFKLFGGPGRGDIVILSEPNTADNKDDLIKRVIGLPGEQVEVKAGQVYINNQPLDEPYIQNRAEYNYPAIVLAKDCYFVLGDNRPVSYDSHYFGCVPKDRVVGHVLMTYYWRFN